MTSPASSYDVVIVGAGLAGLTAALAAAEADSTVLLAEKMESAGGSSRLSGGGFAFADVPAQQQAGIADSTELLRADIERMGAGFNAPELVEAYVAHQAETREWLAAHGVDFTSLSVGSGNSVPRVLRTNPHQLNNATVSLTQS